MAEMPFVSSLVQEDLPVWQQCLDTEFLRRMEDGTLDEACFKGYIVEDSLYLREYAKVFAWGMTKARTMETLRNYYSLLGFVQESEDVTRLHYLEQFGLSEADLQALPLRPENRAYVDCMINAAKNGEGEAECIMACLPCMLSYGWIFQKMLDRSPAVRDTLYGPLVQDYGSVLRDKNAMVSLDQVIRELHESQNPLGSPIVLNGTPAARPRVRDLRVIVS